MNKQYSTPTVEMISIMVQDIMNESNSENELPLIPASSVSKDLLS